MTVFHRLYPNLGLQGCVFNNTTTLPKYNPATTYEFDSMTVGGCLFLDESFFAAPVAICSTRVAEDMTADGAKFNSVGSHGAPDMYNCGVDLKDIQVDGTLSLKGAGVAGVATLSNARIGKNIELGGATFARKQTTIVDEDFPDLNGYTLQCVDMDIGGSFELQTATIWGNATFNSSHIGRRFAISPANFKGSDISFGDVTVANELDLGDSVFPTGCQYHIDGLKYDSISNSHNNEDKDKLLSFVDKANFSEGAFSSLEKYFGDLGRADMANETYFRLRRRELSQLPWTCSGLLARVGNIFLWFFVGYGRYPIWAVLYSVLIVSFGTWVFWYQDNMTGKRDDDREVSYSAFWIA
jgi:hypothetical protein